MYTFLIILISNCIVYDLKFPILSPTCTRKKVPAMPSLKKDKVCNTRRKAITDADEVFSFHPCRKSLLSTLFHNALYVYKKKIKVYYAITLRESWARSLPKHGSTQRIGDLRCAGFSDFGSCTPKQRARLDKLVMAPRHVNLESYALKIFSVWGCKELASPEQVKIVSQAEARVAFFIPVLRILFFTIPGPKIPYSCFWAGIESGTCGQGMVKKHFLFKKYFFQFSKVPLN